MSWHTRFVSFMVAILLLPGCANNVSSRQLAAYSVATGFLTLCDDSDYDYALSHFARPLKDSAAGLATPVYVPSGTCHTYDQNFMNEIGAGQARTGCVAFAVPRGRAPATVRFSPDGGTAGVVRSWSVP